MAFCLTAHFGKMRTVRKEPSDRTLSLVVLWCLCASRAVCRCSVSTGVLVDTKGKSEEWIILTEVRTCRRGTFCARTHTCTHTQCIFFLFSFFLSCLNLRKQNRLNSLLTPYGRISSAQVLEYMWEDTVNLSYYLQRNNYPWRNATLQTLKVY